MLCVVLGLILGDEYFYASSRDIGDGDGAGDGGQIAYDLLQAVWQEYGHPCVCPAQQGCYGGFIHWLVLGTWLEFLLVDGLKGAPAQYSHTVVRSAQGLYQSSIHIA